MKMIAENIKNVLSDNDESRISIDLSPTRILDMSRLFHPISLDGIGKTLSNNDCVTFKKA